MVTSYLLCVGVHISSEHVWESSSLMLEFGNWGLAVF